MEVVVIGGSGFIGTRLCARLAQSQEHPFSIIDRQKSSSFPDKSAVASVGSAEALKALISSKAAIVNLAAEHRDNVKPPERYDEVNVEGARSVCEAARCHDVNIIVFTSTVAVYGFAEPGTDETGPIAPFNRYGLTKCAAETVYREWQAENPDRRTLVIVRPTAVFGEGNRGNVYRLFRQLAASRFIMIGNGSNTKSLAYVENVVAFLEFSLTFTPGIHVYNYVDKPDLSMKDLVIFVRSQLGKRGRIGIRIPYIVGLIAGMAFDAIASLTGRNFNLSAMRVRKFRADSQFNTSISETGFVPPVSLMEGLKATLHQEFLKDNAVEDERPRAKGGL